MIEAGLRRKPSRPTGSEQAFRRKLPYLGDAPGGTPVAPSLHGARIIFQRYEFTQNGPVSYGNRCAVGDRIHRDLCRKRQGTGPGEVNVP